MPDMLTILQTLDTDLRTRVQVEIPPRPPRARLRPEYVAKDVFANNIYYAGYTPVIYLPITFYRFHVPWRLLTIAQTCRERKPLGLDSLVVLLPPRRRPAR